MGGTGGIIVISSYFPAYLPPATGTPRAGQAGGWSPRRGSGMQGIVRASSSLSAITLTRRQHRHELCPQGATHPAV